MKVSEKSLELNVGAELLAMMRGNWGLPKAYLRGLTQAEEKQEGVDFFAQLSPTARLFAFQFKAPKGRWDGAPYRYTLVIEQHELLFSLAQVSADAVFYVFPFYVTAAKLQQDVPNLSQDTWLLRIAGMPTAAVFNGQRTKVVSCSPGTALINPTYRLEKLDDLRQDREASGIQAGAFAAWYERHLGAVREDGRHRNPWLVRGLRLVVVGSSSRSG